MRTKIQAIAMTVAVIICFTVSVHAQKVAITVVDRHFDAQASSYKTIMGLLAAVYVVYLVLHNKRRREVNRFLGKTEIN
jgi:hypothetical protein